MSKPVQVLVEELDLFVKFDHVHIMEELAKHEVPFIASSKGNIAEYPEEALYTIIATPILKQLYPDATPVPGYPLIYEHKGKIFFKTFYSFIKHYKDVNI